jgi:hypothetical protein
MRCCPALAEWSEATSTAAGSPQGQRRVADQFQQFVTPDDGRKFTELYNVQHLTLNKLDGVCRVTISTFQRLYAMLRSLFFFLKKSLPQGEIMRGDRHAGMLVAQSCWQSAPTWTVPISQLT